VKRLLIFALGAVVIIPASFVAPAMADELPDEILGRWCHITTQWDSAAFGMFVQQCRTQTGLNLTKTTQSYFSGSDTGVAVFPNSTCTNDRVTKLVDEHYLVEATCRDLAGPDESRRIGDSHTATIKYCS
jgi:hypothetical protein